MTGEPVYLDVKIVPNSSRNEIAGWLGDSLKIRVHSPPEDGRANRRVLDLLGEKLRLPASDIAITRGAGSQRKTIEIRGISHDELRARLGA